MLVVGCELYSSANAYRDVSFFLVTGKKEERNEKERYTKFYHSSPQYYLQARACFVCHKTCNILVSKKETKQKEYENMYLGY